MVDVAVRPYCGKFQWKGKLPFIFGTVSIKEGTMLQDIEKELYIQLCKILPDIAPLPDLIEILPGSIIFVPEENV